MEEDGETWKIKQDGCGSQYGSPAFIGSGSRSRNHYCGIEISNTRLDFSGDWECELERCNLGENGGCKAPSMNNPTAKRVIRLEVLHC